MCGCGMFVSLVAGVTADLGNNAPGLYSVHLYVNFRGSHKRPLCLRQAVKLRPPDDVATKNLLVHMNLDKCS